MPSSKKNHQMLDCWGYKVIIVMAKPPCCVRYSTHHLKLWRLQSHLQNCSSALNFRL
jgi:hypothetical protein